MDLVRRGVAEIVSEEELEQRLAEAIRTETPLRIKYGIDPSGKDVHIGHMVPVSKMRDFQDAGHHGVLIIGDYTAQIGDPTGRNESRPSLSKEQVLANAATYVEQLMKVLDPEKTEVRYQSEWFEDFSLIQMIRLGQRFTMAQMMSHETFAKRLDEGLPLAMHELMYPMLMAYDSVAIRADVELGGMEQRFNILQGRDLQRAMEQRAQVAVLSPMLPGLDGGLKMGKSLNNYIGVNDPAAEMFGKVMSIRDDLLISYLMLAGGATPESVRMAQARLEQGTNPMEIKRELGRAIVKRYHGQEAATLAEEEFLGVFSRKDQLPEDMLEFAVTENPMRILEIMMNTESAPSLSEARRLIQQGGVTLNGYRVTDVNAEVFVKDGSVLKVGKRRFARLRVSQ
jgi:tyrosyl-tRNA synthetase